MDSCTFDWLWMQIEKSICDIESQFVSSDHNFRRTYDDTKSVIKSEYEAVKTQLKESIYPGRSSENKIDQHKIAACFCKAIIQKKIFSFDIDDEISQRMLLSNYELAYIVSLRIIYIFLLEYYHRMFEEKGYYDTLKKQARLVVPETTLSHDNYDLGRIKTLAFNDINNIEFDLLTYADMMYWVELYNRMIIEKCIDVSTDMF